MTDLPPRCKALRVRRKNWYASQFKHGARRRVDQQEPLVFIVLNLNQVVSKNAEWLEILVPVTTEIGLICILEYDWSS